MIALSRIGTAVRHVDQECPAALTPTTVLAPETHDVFQSKSNIIEEAASWSISPLTRFISPAGWLFMSHKKTPCRRFGTCSSISKPSSPIHKTDPEPMTFYDLPLEIHFHIATYLPDHALKILARHSHSARLRHAYQDADPRGIRMDTNYLSVEEESIYNELRMRDAFEKTPYPHRHSKPCNRMVWSTTRFHCAGCQRSVGCAHFPLEEMKTSVEKRRGIRKITERKCFARISPVKLWDDRVVTWDQLQDAWFAMDGDITSSTLMSDYGQNEAMPTTRIKKIMIPDRFTDEPNTLKIRDLDLSPIQSPGFNRYSGAEATAEYYIDLYTPFRLSVAHGPTVAVLLRQKAPYVCPHLNIARLMARPMVEQPIEFRPTAPPHRPSATVGDVLCAALDRSPWSADRTWRSADQDKPDRRIKEQTVWCGFQGDRCRTAVSLQRFRDTSAENTVRGVWGMRDLVRLRVLRRWRIDRGTGEPEWQAQNGMSIRAAWMVDEAVGLSGSGRG